MWNEEIIESLLRYVGQTVTIFTESGGLSGSGFTGTLAGVFHGAVRLITSIGAPPACPIGSSCIPFEEPAVANTYGCGWGCGCGCGCGCNGGGYAAGAGAAVGYGAGLGYGLGGLAYPNNIYGNNFYGNNAVLPGGFNWLGSVCEIPICKIVSFTHISI